MQPERAATAALHKSLESGDPDSIYAVIFHLRSQMPFDRFLSTIRNVPSALTMYKSYCRRCNPQNLYEIYVKSADFTAQARTFLESPNLGEFHVVEAAEDYRKGRNFLEASLCDDQFKLSTFQKLTEKPKCAGKTVHETCFLLLQTDAKLADQFREVFQIPDRRYWWLKLRSWAEAGQWAEMEEAADSKSCPLGFGAFVDVCLGVDNREEGAKYLARVDANVKVKYLIKMGYFEEAARLAYRRRDLFGLMLLRSRCDYRTELGVRIDGWVRKLDK